MNGITGIDHTLVGVRDLEAARDVWQRLGFAVTPRGRHIGWGTGNYCIMLEPGYIELLGIVDPSQFTNNLDFFLKTREGLMGLAFATDDAAACAEALRVSGIEAEGPKQLKRLLELPEGTGVPEFALVHPAADAMPGLKAFVCQHLTPELIRRPDWLAHPNGAASLLGMTIAVDQPRSLVPAWRRLLGDRAVRADAAATLVETGAGRLLFATPETLAARYRDVAPLPNYTRPWAVAMSLGVADLDRCERVLRGGDFKAVRLGDGIVLPPAATGGVFLEFLEQR
jgi:catechol 2,3-dioxygenase-like lactoylglutathione lyase family enzyme